MPLRPRSFAVLCALGLALAACGSSSSAGGGAGSSSSGAGSATGHPEQVLLKYVSFVPATVTIHAGQTVEWKWEDAPVDHNVTFEGFSASTKADGTYFHTFDTPGTYHYRCTIHAQMTGTVVVLP